jgi:hypothetical protein
VRISEVWDADAERIRDAWVVIGCDPSWGKAQLEAGYRHKPRAGFHLAAAFEAGGEDRRIFFRGETRDVLPLPASQDSGADWLQLFAFTIGWEAKSRRLRTP